MTGSRESFRALKDIQQPSVLATVVVGDRLGTKWLVDEASQEFPAGVRQVKATGEACLVLHESGSGPEEILLEPLMPGRLAPWVHFCSQQLERGKRCALATVVAIEGEAMPYSLGDRFAYDDQSHHGLLPIDAGLSVVTASPTTTRAITACCPSMPGSPWPWLEPPPGPWPGMVPSGKDSSCPVEPWICSLSPLNPRFRFLRHL